MKPIYTAEIKVFPNGQYQIGENSKDLTIQEAEMVLKATDAHASKVLEEMKRQLGVSEIEFTKQMLERNPETQSIPQNS